MAVFLWMADVAKFNIEEGSPVVRNQAADIYSQRNRTRSNEAKVKGKFLIVDDASLLIIIILSRRKLLLRNDRCGKQDQQQCEKLLHMTDVSLLVMYYKLMSNVEQLFWRK